MAAMGSVGTLFSIVDLNATAVASVEWGLWRKAARKEDRVQVDSHLALDVLNRPNDFYSREEWFETGQQHVDLTGEGWTVIVTNVMGWPESVWPIRPDRIEPIPSATDFLAGYIYTGPDGEKIPLGLDQVMRIRMPNPMDPYRGLGPVQAILADADSIKYSAQWNLNFFMNGAEPGGIIEVPTRLSDAQFNEFRDRWNQSHRGVSNAHRVAIVEAGKWVDRKYSHSDMQFAELRHVSRDAIREAFRMHGHMLGDAEDVNRAASVSAEITFARRSTVPRANRWKGMLNRCFLPKFGATAKGLEFDFLNPVAEDEAEDADAFLARATGVSRLVAAGFDGTAAAAAAELPEMTWSRQEVQPGDTDPGGLGGKATVSPPTPTNALPRGGDGVVPARMLDAAPAPDEQVKPEDVDLTPVQEAWLFALNSLLALWAADVTAPQRRALVEQVEAIVASGDLGALADMTVDTDTGTAILTTAMTGLADLAGRHVVQEAARQGVTLTAEAAEESRLSDWAGLTSDLIALGLRVAAAREAQRRATPDVSAAEVAHQVQQALAALSDASVRGALGSALTAAQNAGRLSTMAAGPEAALYADERMDSNTCLAPEVMVTTRTGDVYAKDVTLDDELLTHAGRWVRPSHITVSEVQEELVRIVAGGRSLRLTWDHPVLVARGSGFAWCHASDLACGDLVVGELPGQDVAEIGLVDGHFGETPHRVAATDEVCGFPSVDVGTQRVPVGAVSLDDKALTHQEVNHPRTDLGLRPVDVSQGFEHLTHTPFDAGFGVAGAVAGDRAVALAAGGGRNDSEAHTALAAGERDRGASARLGTVAADRGLTVPEPRTAAHTGGRDATRGATARAGAVVESMGDGDGGAELLLALGAGFDGLPLRAADLREQFRIGELAFTRAVDSAVPAATGDLAGADLASRRRVVRALVAPARKGAASLAPLPSGDMPGAVNTQSVHDVSVLKGLVPVTCIERDPYAGNVYDFTVPGDETFWAEGVLVHNCAPCRAVNGRWLGNVSDMAQVERMYGAAGYVDCIGAQHGNSCRGTVISIWRPLTTNDGGDD